MKLLSRNPTTERITAEYPVLSDAEIDRALNLSQRAFEHHRVTRFEERARKLVSVAESLDRESRRWGELLTEEMGKPLAAAIAEVEKCAWVCRYYAEHGETFLRDQSLDSDAKRSYVTCLPLGPVAAVMPWNFPFWQVFRFAAPTLMAGNVVVLKHASNVPRAAVALQEIFERGGFERGVFQALLIGSGAVARVLQDERVRAVSVTGSVRAGSSVAAVAGHQIKKTVLELGGSDAFIVMPSADLEDAIEVAATSRLLNNGQSCIAAKRFIIHEAIYDAFIEGLAERFAKLEIGDPMDRETDVGPLAMSRQRDRLASQVDGLIEHGARRVLGARKLDRRGFFFEPGILTNVQASSSAYREELFGPVAVVFKARDLDAAIARANDTPYGLASSIWTREASEAFRAVRDIRAGATFVNSLVASDPRLPFGGVGCSGYGRELARDGILEFVNRKTVSFA